jgi:hypothetical protein
MWGEPPDLSTPENVPLSPEAIQIVDQTMSAFFAVLTEKIKGEVIDRTGAQMRVLGNLVTPEDCIRSAHQAMLDAVNDTADIIRRTLP